MLCILASWISNIKSGVLDLVLGCGPEYEVSGTCPSRVCIVRLCLHPGLHVSVEGDL